MPCDTAGLGYSPFARRYWGNRFYFLFLRVLRCFSSPRSLPGHSGVTGSLPPGCPIRRSTGQRIFAPYRGFSQLVTSFFASESQGIPHAPFVHSVISSQNARSAFVVVLPKPLYQSVSSIYFPARTGARCSLFEFLLCLLACSGLQSATPGFRLAPYAFAASIFQNSFHHVNVLFPMWRITESNR